jgi:hypothetical protein
LNPNSIVSSARNARLNENAALPTSVKETELEDSDFESEEEDVIVYIKNEAVKLKSSSAL